VIWELKGAISQRLKARNYPHLPLLQRIERNPSPANHNANTASTPSLKKASTASNGQTFVSPPGRAGGLPHYELGEAHTAWNTVSDKPWQFEVICDHVMESRYRLEGQKPVLVESRGRDPAIGFQGMVLAVLTLVIWKTTKWWRRRRAAANQPTID
jgi:hypothetical protein